MHLGVDWAVCVVETEQCRTRVAFAVVRIALRITLMQRQNTLAVEGARASRMARSTRVRQPVDYPGVALNSAE